MSPYLVSLLQSCICKHTTREHRTEIHARANVSKRLSTPNIQTSLRSEIGKRPGGDRKGDAGWGAQIPPADWTRETRRARGGET
ncbi:unnamed protein product [Colias eurytheme]|nr:unnamed protein product [Colias eurytheme]